MPPPSILPARESILGDVFPALVVPVTLDGALAWAAGEIDDAALWSEATPEPGAVWWLDLRDRSGWRPGLRALRFWCSSGARVLVARTRVPMVRARLARCFKATRTFLDSDGRERYVVDPAGLGAYVSRAGRSAQNSPAASGVVNSR